MKRTQYERSISPTTDLKSLPAFGGCMRQLWYRKIVKPRPRKNKTDRTGATIGILVHSLMEEALYWWRYGYGSLKTYDFKNKLSELLVTKHTDLDTNDEILEKVIEYVDLACEWLEGFYRCKLYMDPEIKLIYMYKAKNGKTYQISGTIDVVLVIKEKEGDRSHLCICDFKSGQLKYENEQGEPQFTTYAWLFEKLYNTTVSYVYIFGLQDRQIKKIEVPEHYTADVEDLFETYLDATSNEFVENYPKNETPRCQSWCEYSEDCLGIVMGKRV